VLGLFGRKRWDAQLLRIKPPSEYACHARGISMSLRLHLENISLPVCLLMNLWTVLLGCGPRKIRRWHETENSSEKCPKFNGVFKTMAGLFANFKIVMKHRYGVPTQV
jgi:hypothetical protein